MKTARLDEILLKKGLVTEDQIKQALMRQRSTGGKLGSQLLYYRFISEKQLLNALAEQFSVAGVELEEQNIPDDVIKKVPVELVEEHMVFPFKFEPETNTLSVAIADPDNSIAIAAVKRSARVSKVIAHVAPEIILRNLIVSRYHGKSRDLSMDQIVSLPNLFEEEASGDAGSIKTGQPEKDAAFADSGYSAPKPPKKVLMVSGRAFLKNLLPSILEREGFELRVASNPKQLEAAFNDSSYESIVVSEDTVEMFDKFIADSVITPPLPEISVFKTIAAALTENPAPYSKMFASLLKSVQVLADYRCSALSWQPPYALISNDIRETGRLLALRSIAVDGLQVAAHLLVPAEKALQKAEITPAGTGTARSRHSSHGPFHDLDDSISLAESINFPWNIPACLKAFSDLIAGTASLTDLEKLDDISLAAQVLALTCYRHYAFRDRHGSSSPETAFDKIKSGLRNQAGRLASSSVVETYISVLERSFKQHAFSAGRDIFVVGKVQNLSANLVNELKRHGFRTVEISDPAEMQHLYKRQRPDAVLLNYDRSPALALEFGRLVTQDSMGAGVAMFALTASTEPSLIMNLIESGFNDVFAPPFSNDVIVARISKTLTLASQKDPSSATHRGFSATFNELSFLDLIQALAGGLKNVRICLERSTGEKADIYLREGRMVHAVCGSVTGVEAVYLVVAWRDDGNFRIEPTTDFPPDNISAPNDSILLEGCRLLDEMQE